MDSQYLTYPIDSNQLLRKKLRIRESLLNSDISFIEKRIAVLGGSTTSEIIDQLELFLLNYGIRPVFYESEYAQYWEDAVFGNEDLDSFRPDVLYFHTNWRNITSFPTLDSTLEQTNLLLEEEYRRLELMWEKVREKYDCPIIQDNFDRPAWRLLGNRDISDYRGKTNFITRLNQLLYAYAQEHEGFYINDVDYLASCYGLEAWSNPLYWYNYKYSLNLEAIPSLAKSVSEIIKSIYGKNKKLLALDLDNTVWGGVVGDDGVEGIRIGPETPIGEAYSEFQSYVKELKSIGILLAVNSKNDRDNAIAGLNHPSSVLHPDDFVSIQANWESKDQNMLSIASELNLGLDSFVFVDDNPTEREIVRQADFGVAVPEMNRVETFFRSIDRSGYFEVTTISDDDLKRVEMYQANQRRALMEKTLTSYEDFLKSLNMKAVIKGFEPIYIQRIAQLTNKSNQFNLTTLRCSESDITRMKESPDYLCLCGRLEDKFGDNGVVSVIAGERRGLELHLRLWLMSCRVLKRGMEEAMLDTLVEKAKETGVETIVGYYYPTQKNEMVKDFYGRMGFERVQLDPDGRSVWICDVSSYQKRNVNICIER